VVSVCNAGETVVAGIIVFKKSILLLSIDDFDIHSIHGGDHDLALGYLVSTCRWLACTQQFDSRNWRCQQHHW
jgi:hypothetical protein